MIKNLFMHYYMTIVHKLWVIFYGICIILKLLYRISIHDLSKFSLIESKGFMKTANKLRNVNYGSDEYKELLHQNLKKAVQYHYRINRHHPEHFKNEFNDMDIVDLIELICDWKAAIKKHKTGNFLNSMKINRERFNLDDDLYYIIKNSRNI